MVVNRDQLLACAAMMQRVGVLHQAAAAESMQELGVPGSAVALLWLLSRGLSARSMRDLARDLSCDPSNVTLQAIVLEEAGLVERVPDVADRRRRIPRLTDRGRAAGSALADAVTAASPLADLDDAQLDAITHVLRTALHDR